MRRINGRCSIVDILSKFLVNFINDVIKYILLFWVFLSFFDELGLI